MAYTSRQAQLVTSAYQKYLKRTPSSSEIQKEVDEAARRGENESQWQSRIDRHFAGSGKPTQPTQPAAKSTPAPIHIEPAGNWTPTQPPASGNEQETADWQLREQARLAVWRLGFNPDQAREGVEYARQALERGTDPRELSLLLTQKFPQEIATRWLKDEKSRETFRKTLREDVTALEAIQREGYAGGDGGGPTGQMTSPYAGVLQQIDRIPVPFLRPDLTISREEASTEEGRLAFARKHGLDASDPINRMLLDAALKYGALSAEPTPFGTVKAAPSRMQWTRPSSTKPGPVESALAGRSDLGPAELSAIAQERMGQFRLESDDPYSLSRQIAKGVLASIFATAGGMAAGPVFGAAAAGTGLASGAGGATTAGIASGIGGGAVGGAVGGGVAGRGNLDAIWQGALGGALTGGLGSALPAASNAGTGALRGAGIGAATNLAGQAVRGDEIDWAKLASAIASGATSGSFTGSGGTGNPILDMFAKYGIGLTGGLSGALTNKTDPLATVNEKLAESAEERAAQMADRMRQQQEAAIAAQRAEMAAWQSGQRGAIAAHKAALQKAMDEYNAKRDEFVAQRTAATQDQMAKAEANRAARDAALANLREQAASYLEQVQSARKAPLPPIVLPEGPAPLAPPDPFDPSFGLSQQSFGGDFPISQGVASTSGGDFPISQAEAPTAVAAPAAKQTTVQQLPLHIQQIQAALAARRR